ncbi:MAG: glycoside hydrolase family 99-like domain-containing protein [Bryobacteraceae bacterium]
MNVAFVSHCDFTGNSAMHIFSIASVLERSDIRCAVCVPNDAANVSEHGTPAFAVVSYADAYANGVLFPDGRGPDVIHAWTPRELVRKLTEHLASVHDCPYIVHLEDNEEVILEVELEQTYGEIESQPIEVLDLKVPEHRSHPVHYRSFLSRAAAVTALMDRLLEFKPEGVPGMVFWPGFDDEFLNPPAPSSALLSRFQLRPNERVLVYNGNVHATNSAEVQSLFLSVQALRRVGVPVRLLRTGLNHIDDTGWIEDAVASGAVVDLGFVPRSEVPSLVSLATALVQPGRPGRFNDYRFPSKLPEFLVSGKPVVLPKANIGRFLRDGVEAVLTESGDAIEIAQKVERLLNEPERAATMGAAGREFALKRLSWEINVPPIVDLYKDVIEQRTAAASIGSADLLSTIRLISFFLPQFHRIKENDEFWGEGFTEWTNVRRAVPNFHGHYQPQVPADLGYYDLSDPQTLQRQVELAAGYGIYGFCFYYYWFNDRRVLERPLEQMLETGQPDFPFCICWANENWTRSWDGSEQDILIAQEYSSQACERFIRDVIPILKDRRYICVGGAPMLLVYRADQIPGAAAVARRWREICSSEGIPALHLCAVQSFDALDPRTAGFDAAVEFPPHVTRALLDLTSIPGLRDDFKGYAEDYATIVRNQLSLTLPDHILYRGVMPAWDNTPRRGTSAHIVLNSSPERYEEWLYGLAKQALGRQTVQEPILFVNAWNEWAEGAYLEPDQKHGHARLRATRSALTRAARDCRQQPVPLPPVKRNPSEAEHNLIRTYRNFAVTRLSYGTVRDYCDSFENLRALATANGDLKDCQRPWVVKAILTKAPPPGCILEIGAGEPLVADLLSRLGYEVWIADPYDGSGNGPREFETFRRRYPHLRFVRSQFHERLPKAPRGGFDCIYSISVLEHVPESELPRVFSGLRNFLKPGGASIHAIDHVLRGSGAAEHLAKLRLMVHGFGFDQADLDALLKRMNADTETYYLSAEAHNRWRNDVPYDQFPMRVCVSIQTVADAHAIRVAGANDG